MTIDQQSPHAVDVLDGGVLSGLSLVLTHGYGQTRSVWNAQVAHLSQGHEIRSWDLPGHGLQPPPQASGFDVDDLVRELESVIRSCSAPPVLVGHSVGGYLSLRCALTSTTPLLGLVLISAGPGFRSPDGMQEWNGRIDRITSRLGMSAGTGRAIYMKDTLVVDRLASLALPTLVITGGQDREIYRRGCTYIAGQLPNGGLLTVADAAHSPHETHPELVNAAITEFVGNLT
jgi:3-oxoadipate enol-lactonase